ncbi:MAG: molybdate ABC transporter substrate-binding protein [Leifsonia sp.]
MTRGTRVLAAGLAVAVSVAVAGCAGPSASPEPVSTGAAGAPLAGTVMVFAAASLTDSFDTIAADFSAIHPGVDVVPNYGGSSALAQQIVQGAPADVFAAASEAAMTTVTDADLSDEPTVFATNTLEIVVPAGNPAGITGLADLARPELAIALCDVAVPCGAAADQLFQAVAMTAAPDTLEEDVKAVLTKVSLGEADAGLVYRTDVLAGGAEVEGIEVPEAETVVNRYPIARISASANGDAAAAFIDYVLSPAGQATLAAAGFGKP